MPDPNPKPTLDPTATVPPERTQGAAKQARSRRRTALPRLRHRCALPALGATKEPAKRPQSEVVDAEGKVIREPAQLVFQDDTAPLEDEEHRPVERWR